MIRVLQFFCPNVHSVYESPLGTVGNTETILMVVVTSEQYGY